LAIVRNLAMVYVVRRMYVAVFYKIVTDDLILK